MRISVLETHQVPFPKAAADPQVVVIDVLRATSCMITALAGGAAAVIPCLTPQEARASAAALPPGSYLLGGERKCRPLPGFDLGNSPLEYTPEKVQGKRIITTTTNGTSAIRRAVAAGAGNILLGAFLNSSAVAVALRRDQDVLILCAGTDERFSLDDFAAAGRLVDLLADGACSSPDDAATAALSLYRDHANRLPHLLRSSAHGKILAETGLERDLAYCAQLDLFGTVPRWDGEAFRAAPPPSP